MPVGHHQQYTSRPYSSFRAPRSSCIEHHTTKTKAANSNDGGGNDPEFNLYGKSSYAIQQTPMSNGNINANNKITAVINGNSSNSSSVCSQQQTQPNNNYTSPTLSSNNKQNHFTRQQPFRSSFYSTRCSNHHNINHNSNNQNNTNGICHSNSNHSMLNDRRFSNVTISAQALKPLTPKLVRRIEHTCANVNNTNQTNTNNTKLTSTITTTQTHHHNHNKPRAPAPPSTPPTANKQYLRSRNQTALVSAAPPTPPVRRNHQNFERFHNSNLSFRQKTAGMMTNTKSPAVSSTSESMESTTQPPKYASSTYYNSNLRTSGSQKRAYTTVSRATKENLPNGASQQHHQHQQQQRQQPIRSYKNYPAPLPPCTPKATVFRKQQNLTTSSVSASPNLNNRRMIANHANLNGKSTPTTQRRRNFQQATNSTHNTNPVIIKNGSTGSNASTSTASSGSHGSPKTKKAFSNKFPQGLPFEDEFYLRRYSRRSCSQSSSSSYSYYSSVGGNGNGNGSGAGGSSVAANNSTPHSPRGYDDELSIDDDDDEFQRKPSHDDSLYVDFTKVMQRREYPMKTTIMPTTTWIGEHTSASVISAASLIMNQQTTTKRTTKSKISHSINDYLYTTKQQQQPQQKTTNSIDNVRKLSLDEPEDGYYTHTSPEPPTNNAKSNVYLAVASWAPKCSHPTRVHIPANEDKNNNSRYQRDYHHNSNNRKYDDDYYANVGDVLESTNSEYNFDRSSRRRKERSKRSHRKSPTSSRRVHKYRYRDETSHSSSNRRNRRDGRESGRTTRRSHSKNVGSTIIIYFLSVSVQ